MLAGSGVLGASRGTSGDAGCWQGCWGADGGAEVLVGALGCWVLAGVRTGVLDASRGAGLLGASRGVAGGAGGCVRVLAGGAGVLVGVLGCWVLAGGRWEVLGCWRGS